MQTINIHEAKTHLSRLLEEVAAGAAHSGNGFYRGSPGNMLYRFLLK